MERRPPRPLPVPPPVPHKTRPTQLIDMIVDITGHGERTGVHVGVDPALLKEDDIRKVEENLEKVTRSALDLSDRCTCDVNLSLSEVVKLEVTSGESCYRATSPAGLAISRYQPFVDYFKEYRRYHEMQPKSRNSSMSSLATSLKSNDKGDQNVQWKESTIQAGPACFRFFRTLRVPDAAGNYPFPPGLGTFPLEPTNKFSRTLEKGARIRGGFLMPMFQREALWIHFGGSANCAIKVSVGGINALTGRPRDETPPSGVEQDYLALPKQPWLDGVCLEPGIVRQFVAMELGKGYTVEEQITGLAVHGGIQIDVFPSLAETVSCTTVPDGAPVDITLSPDEAGLRAGIVVKMESNLPKCETIEEFRSRISSTLHASVTCSERPFTVHVKTTQSSFEVTAVKGTDRVDDLAIQIKDMCGIPPEQQRLVYRSKELLRGRRLEDYGIDKECDIHLVRRSPVVEVHSSYSRNGASYRTAVSPQHSPNSPRSFNSSSNEFDDFSMLSTTSMSSETPSSATPVSSIQEAMLPRERDSEQTETNYSSASLAQPEGTYNAAAPPGYGFDSYTAYQPLGASPAPAPASRAAYQTSSSATYSSAPAFATSPSSPRTYSYPSTPPANATSLPSSRRFPGFPQTPNPEGCPRPNMAVPQSAPPIAPSSFQAQAAPWQALSPQRSPPPQSYPAQAPPWQAVSHERLSPPQSSARHRPMPFSTDQEPTVEPARVMGVAAGGKITQKIYKDERPANVYDEESGYRVWVHTISSSEWERVTGVLPPFTPIDPDTYRRNKLPWFSLYDEQVESIQSSGILSKLKSVRQLDVLRRDTKGGGSTSPIINPDKPPGCSKHSKTKPSCVLRPCGHLACEACFGAIILRGSQCSHCSKPVSTFVGLTRPVGKIRKAPPTSAGSSQQWTVEQKEEDSMEDLFKVGVIPLVETLILEEDRISRPHRRK